MKLIDAAKQFLQSKSAKTQAFLDRNHQLQTKLTELDAKKSQLISAYDPTKPFDQKAIDKIEADIASVQKELSVLNEAKASSPVLDVSESVDHIEKVKSEAQAIIAKKKAAEEEARAKIAEAKTAFLQAQADHFQLVRQAGELVQDTNETIGALSSGIKREIERLRNEFREVDLQLYRNAGDGSVFAGAVRSDQAQIDDLQARKESLGREIQRLEALVSPVGAGIPALNNYRDNKGNTIYFVHQPEQLDAAERGVITK